MAIVERLVKTNQLKTTLLFKLVNRKQPPYLLYDRETDELLLQFISPDTMTIVHYTDDNNVAFLYLPDTMEIVGFQIEAFQKNFLPQHSSLKHVWNLSDPGIQLENLDDLAIIFEQKKQEIAQEMITLTEPMLQESIKHTQKKQARIPA